MSTFVRICELFLLLFFFPPFPLQFKTVLWVRLITGAAKRMVSVHGGFFSLRLLPIEN